MALSTTNPGGTSAEGRRAFCMMVIPPKHHQAESEISSKMSQSQFCTPIDNQRLIRALSRITPFDHCQVIPNIPAPLIYFIV
jgi:hypothetical protein